MEPWTLQGCPSFQRHKINLIQLGPLSEDSFHGASQATSAPNNFSADFAPPYTQLPNPTDTFDESDSDSSPNFTANLDQGNTASSLGCWGNIEMGLEEVVEEELNQLVEADEIATRESAEEAADIVMEDTVSRLFNEDLDCIEEGDNVADSTNEPFDNAYLNEEQDNRRLHRDRGVGGLRGWNYDTPFKEFTVTVDDVDSFLEKSFIKEDRTTYRRVLSRMRPGASTDDTDAVISSPLQLFRFFLPASILQKVVDTIEPVLISRDLKTTSVREVESVIIMNSLCAAYREPMKTIASDTDSFLPFPMKPRRDHDLWSSMSCTLGKPQRAKFQDPNTWCFLSSESHAFMTQIENEVASINRKLFYIPGSTIFSLDDDVV